MIRPRGGFIGAETTPTNFTAPGVWSLQEVYEFQKDGNWPIQINAGEDVYTTAGTFTWVAPFGVTSVSVVCIGGGGGGDNGGGTAGGGGGELRYKNNITVVPGTSYTVRVGPGGGGGFQSYEPQYGSDGQNSYFINTSTVNAIGGKRGSFSPTPGLGGSGGVGDGGGNGGNGATGVGGGGGAGGYSGNGGNAGGSLAAGSPGSGGGGGGGQGGNHNNVFSSGGGGGTGLFGLGANGTGGVVGTATGGGGGSSGNNGTSDPTSKTAPGGTGGLPGGGGGKGKNPIAANSVNDFNRSGGAGRNGAVRIVYPGDIRQFPSTLVESTT